MVMGCRGREAMGSGRRDSGGPRSGNGIVCTARLGSSPAAGAKMLYFLCSVKLAGGKKAGPRTCAAGRSGRMRGEAAPW